MQSINRRQFLRTSAAGLGAALIAGRLTGAAERPATYYDPVEVVKLGGTKIKMTRVGMGTGMHGGGRQSNHTRMGFENFNTLIKTCWYQGMRWFDVADLYGTHPFLARSLAQMPRKDYVISTKIWWRSGSLPEHERPGADAVVERFLKELGTDYIDIVQLHCLASKDWPTELSEYMTGLDKCKQKGLIRAHGISCHSLESLETAIAEPWVDTVHARINPFGAKMDGPTEKVEPVLRKLHEAGKGLIAMKVIGEGTFGNDGEKKDQSIKYVLQGGFIDAITIGFEKVEHIDDFTARARKVPVVTTA